MTDNSIGARYAEIDRRVKSALDLVHKRGLLSNEIDQESRGFLIELRNLLEIYLEDAFISVKQLNWLSRIEQDLDIP